MLGGICGAGDGFVVQISEPVKSDLNGRQSKTYMNRKGFSLSWFKLSAVHIQTSGPLESDGQVPRTILRIGLY